MRLDFELAGSQIDGARDYQEDAFLITHLTDTDGNPSALIIVADGMGGHAAGNVASNMAVQAFNKHVSSHYPTLAVSKILEEAVDKANLSIRETIEETPALQGMGCTMIGAILEKGKIWWASVGDSHLYLVRESGIAKINQDHSYGGFIDRMEAAGKFIEPDPGLTRNMLMSAITGETVNEIDCPDTPRELYPDDRVLICTDGMDTLSNGKILEFMTNGNNPKECSDSLMQAVIDADMPRQDNTTAVVANISGEKISSKPLEQPVAETENGIAEDNLNIEAIEENLTAESINIPKPETDPYQSNIDDYPDSDKSYTGLIISALALLVLIGIGVYYFLPKSPTDTPPIVTTPIEEPSEIEVTDIVDEPLEDELDEETEEIDEPLEDELEELSEPETEVAVVIPIEVEEFTDKLNSGGNSPTMVKLPAGKFKMGNSNTTRFANEQPVHDVNINAFAISKYEITFAQYDRFAKATGRGLPNSKGLSRSENPVSKISWANAKAYTEWLSKQTGQSYQLPTEAQWEYAATAGEKEPYPWGYKELSGKAHCLTCNMPNQPIKQTKVGSYPVNKFGLHDMNGNVAEWVQECWHRNYADAPSTGELRTGGDCSYRTVRGGSFESPQSSLRSQRRDKYGAKNTYDNIGFRVVRILD